MPITVYRGYKRTSTFITDMAATLANIHERFRPGEVYNIGGDDFHTIEEVAELVVRLAGQTQDRARLLQFKGEEILTTREKAVDCAKARRDLAHKSTVSLEDGVAQTIAWMRKVYAI